jgi:hypothetical protein
MRFLENITEDSDIFNPSNEDLVKIDGSSLYIKATEVIKETQNLSNKIERNENLVYKDG